MASKSELAILLSSLKQFENPKILLEQYSTDPEIAATVLWNAYMQGDIQKKRIADLGCGPGIFGIGAAVLGAKSVCFVDMDEFAITTTKQNLALVQQLNKSKIQIIQSDVKEFTQKVDVVLMNPPFGTKIKHHDRLFLTKSFEIADMVYSIHKLTSKAFIEAFAKDSNFEITHIWPYKMRLVRSMKHHKKPVMPIEVACWRLRKKSHTA